MDKQEDNCELHMLKVVFDNISFERKGFENDNTTKYSCGINIGKISDGHFRVNLVARADKKNEFSAKISISGFFEVEENSENKDNLLKQNAVAILYPYLRSEFTILTAQPNTQPIILPVVNIVDMVENSEEEKSKQKPQE